MESIAIDSSKFSKEELDDLCNRFKEAQQLMCGQLSVYPTHTLDKYEVIADVADTLDNLIAASKLPWDAKAQLEQTAIVLGRTMEKLRAVYVSLTGEDPWNEAEQDGDSDD